MYENSFGTMPQPANNLWVGNNYSSGYSQMSRNNYSQPQQMMQNQRQSINNVQRSASLFLTKTIFSTILAIVFLFATRSYPFMPIQIRKILINLYR